eukprot:m.298278 g.298278  ORF g.298278 m.298278 type:complete len:155 (+) comp40782_c0_seq22:2651-3115(+)
MDVFDTIDKIPVHLLPVGLYLLGWCLQRMGKKSDAINALDEGLKLAENSFVEKDWDTMCFSLLLLANLHSDMNRKDVALLHYRRAFNVAKELSPEHSSTRRKAVLKFFECLIELRHFSEAEGRMLDFKDSPMSDDHFLVEQINGLLRHIRNCRS